MLKRRQRGASLVEMLLGVAVSMMMLVYVGKMQAQAANDARAKAFADQIQSVRTVAVRYFQSNRAALVAAMNTGASASTWCAANDTAKKVCVLDVPKLIANGVAPAGFKATFPGNQRVVVSYRLVNAATGQTEILVFGGTNGGSEQAFANDLVGYAAQMIGESGGIVPQTSFGACSTAQACGSAGAWAVTLSNFTAGTFAAVLGTVASYAIVI